MTPWDGGPRLSGSAASLGCSVETIYEGGDHWIVIGRVIALYRAEDTGRPLVLLHGGLSAIEIDFGRVLPTFAESRQVIAVKQQPPRPPAILRALFKSVLGWINKILGSLKAVFPPAEAIQEFKGFVEQGVDDLQNIPFENP